jgi:hypothetical protein
MFYYYLYATITTVLLAIVIKKIKEIKAELCQPIEIKTTNLSAAYVVGQQQYLLALADRLETCPALKNAFDYQCAIVEELGLPEALDGSPHAPSYSKMLINAPHAEDSAPLNIHGRNADGTFRKVDLDEYNRSRGFKISNIN